MRFVNTNDGGLIWPAESVSGAPAKEGVLLDTGWEISWPGPGHVYLSDGDILDIIVPAVREREEAREALRTNGWTAPDETAATVAELEQELEETRALYAEAKVAEAGFDAALKKLEAARKPAAKPKTKS